MPVDTTPMRQERHGLIEKARAILNKADEEKRALSAEDRQEYDRLWAEQGKLDEQIQDDERRNNVERAEQEKLNRDKEEDRREKGGEERKTSPLVGGHDAEYRARCTDEYHHHFLADWFARNDIIPEEARATHVAGEGQKGGYLYASEQFLQELLKDVDDATKIRQMARVLQVRSADSLGVPTITTKMTDAEWTSELGVPNEGDIVLAQRALTPHPLAKECRVSKILARKAPNIVSLVREELARVVAEAEENAMMTGDGAQKPLGIFTASDDGIPTGRDVSTGNTTTAVKFDNLKRVKTTLKQSYWGNASWVMHRDVFGQIAREKDGNARYLLQDSVAAGEPDRLLGFPVVLSEFAPNTMTSALYVGALGDFRNYWVVDGLDTDVERLEELEARNNRDVFIIRAMMDGAPVRAEAFVRVKLG